MRAAYYCGDRKVEVGACEIQAPEPGEVRIEVAYCGVCGTDLHIYMGHMDGRIDMPQVIGHEMAGKIAELGEGVEGWSVGDPVVVRPLDACGKCAACKAGNSHVCQKLNFIGIDSPGAFQGSWTVPAHTLHRLPADMPMDLGALVEPMAVACHDVRLGEVVPGEKAVVIGGGPIGLLNALVAQHAGAEVRIAEVNDYRLEMARAAGVTAIGVAWGYHPVQALTEAGADHIARTFAEVVTLVASALVS